MPVKLPNNSLETASIQNIRLNGFAVKLQTPRFQSPDELFPLSINPLPPRFAHTWALDLIDIDIFNLPLEPNEIGLNFAQGDRLIFTQALPDGGRYTIVIDSHQKLVDTVIRRNQSDSGKNPWRLFVTVETDNSHVDRLIKLTRLLKIGNQTGNEKALVLNDDILLDTNGPICADTYTDINNVERHIYAPWTGPNRNTGVDKFKVPEPEKGWCLLARNMEEPVSGFFTLAYYNEATSKLRLYLLNLAVTPDASAYQVELSVYAGMESQNPLQLKGAFFPLKTDPTGWSEVSLVIPKWAPETWAFVEVPFLYPMASNLPLEDPDRIVSDTSELFSVYDDYLKEDYRNVCLYIRITPYLKGKLEGTLDAKAVGEAVQTFRSNTGDDFIDLAKGVFEAAKTGIPIASNLEGDLEKFKKKVINKLGEAWWSTPLLSLSTFAGPLAAVGAIASALDGIFGSDPEPLQLALELEIKGILSGTIFTPLQERTYWFYLPGRCHLPDAFQNGLQQYPSYAVDQHLPRYEYPIGLIGYRLSPSTFVVPATHCYTDHTTVHLIPGANLDRSEIKFANEVPVPEVPDKLGVKQIDDVAALIRNPHVRFELHLTGKKGTPCDYLPVPNKVTWEQIDSEVELTSINNIGGASVGLFDSLELKGPGSTYTVQLTLNSDYGIYNAFSSQGEVLTVHRPGYENGVVFDFNTIPDIFADDYTAPQPEKILDLVHTDDKIPFMAWIGNHVPGKTGTTSPFIDILHHLSLASTFYSTQSDRVYLRRSQLYFASSLFSTSLPFNDAYDVHLKRYFVSTSATILNNIPPRLWDVRTSTQSKCAIHIGLVTSKTPVYTDRDFKYDFLPGFLEGAIYLSTANNDKFNRDKIFLSFRVNKPVTVYVAHDERFMQRPRFNRFPKWLVRDLEEDSAALKTHLPWADGTYLPVSDNGNSSFRLFLYQLHFSEGVVRLGGNHPDGDTSNFSMYTVFVKFLEE